MDGMDDIPDGFETLAEAMTTMTRRTFIQTAASALGAIFVPGVLRGAWVQPQLPVGLGMGVNLGMAEIERDAAMALAVATLQPDWFYHWRQWPATAYPGFVPALQPCPGPGHQAYPADVALIGGYRWAMAEAGGDLAACCWIIGNEPEFSGWTPDQTAAAMAAQARVLWDAGLTPVVIAPGGNIAPREHLDYLLHWRDAAARHGLAYTLAVHLYAAQVDWLVNAWHQLCAELDATEQVIVTECGAGYDQPMAAWLAVMPWLYTLAHDPRVRALAPFAAYPQAGYPGYMTHDGALTALGEQWMEYR